MPVRPGEGPRGPDGALGYLVRQTQLTLRRALDDALRDLAVTTPQFSLLSVLDLEPGLSGADLARASMLTPQTTHGIVLALERRGLVDRATDAADRRVRQVTLTDAGREVLRDARDRVLEVERRMTAPLTDVETEQLRHWLVACARSLEETAAGDDPDDQGRIS
jgi:DNA-binding MarR family transcriptional regulator